MTTFSTRSCKDMPQMHRKTFTCNNSWAKLLFTTAQVSWSTHTHGWWVSLLYAAGIKCTAHCSTGWQHSAVPEASEARSRCQCQNWGCVCERSLCEMLCHKLSSMLPCFLQILCLMSCQLRYLMNPKIVPEHENGPAGTLWSNLLAQMTLSCCRSQQPWC